MAPAQSKPVPVDGADKICFLDLPPEIRNSIYELCLVRARDPQAALPYLQLGTATIEPGRGKARPCLQPGLLGVCKQIYEEAMPVLYGNILYKLSHDRVGDPTDPGSMQASARRNEAVKHVRHVKIGACKNQQAFYKILRDMSGLSSLATVTISWMCRMNFRKPSTMSKALLPVLDLLVSHAVDADSNEAIDRLHLELAPVHMLRWASDRYVTQAFAEETKDLLRAALT